MTSICDPLLIGGGGGGGGPEGDDDTAGLMLMTPDEETLLLQEGGLGCCDDDAALRAAMTPPWGDEDERELLEFVSDSIAGDGDGEAMLLDDKQLFESSLSPPESLLEGDSNSCGDAKIDLELLVEQVKKEAEEEGVTIKVEEQSASVAQPVSHCGVCKLVFADPHSLSRHRDDHSRSLCCCQCGKRFVSASKLACHQRKHSKEKPFQCSSCGKYYTHRTTLARHQLHYCQTLRAKCEDSADLIKPLEEDLHSSLLPALTPEVIGAKSSSSSPNVSSPSSSSTKCNVCSREFHDAASLSNHSSHHLDVRTCCLCGKVLGNKSKLLTHHRSHTKESPYSCAFCGKRFSENSTLRKHEATHGARNFQCHLCQRGFVRKDYLNKHLLTHRQTYRCSSCQFVCHDRADIEAHVAVVHAAAGT